jgi:hypothetical protein
MASIFFKIMYPKSFSGILCDRFPKPLFICALVLLVCGCAKSTTPLEVETEQSTALADPELQSRIPGSVAVPVALLDLQAGSTLARPLPAITSIEVLAESGLQLAYTQSKQIAIVPALNVEANWLHMQSCLKQVGVAPLVIIRSSDIFPLTSSDDVIHTIDGIPVASASPGAIPVFQIGLSDFLVSGDTNGYNLRSIMGRMLWSSAGLSVRDYPYSCAQRLNESE